MQSITREMEKGASNEGANKQNHTEARRLRRTQDTVLSIVATKYGKPLGEVKPCEGCTSFKQSCCTKQYTEFRGRCTNFVPNRLAKKILPPALAEVSGP